ncbi:MAG: NAD(P)-dependent glycerol-3-phosphate dehydrogenase [Akkermansiaceae bacterium]|jgi:glycerol-3-phosphate dehydrogenase (NAD(P)+)|nr:NAD(P)-dependent glycerol-3-phosphate dehydrogenase [Akkermansiaceae bacterium]MDP4646786.1 NAD(P)-dependent glycerol-3-phosphate dehydrogenase [Akkermansiaceae bacterium]MDP4720014.1 NAD(P)-dependent glycerol-3-phosphate dehydrogenase [Akkermansiaceae bacterium]MDP4779702.1 NAD(P)-dependent glycerol-3-phosphate dehydrogenase [Akkermansiaceae bacterium]MDP4846639.1 NAD(P)-dependent glycerol-3-phosphate dehydrogenase [Akkermansiaceae bacterium]
MNFKSAAILGSGSFGTAIAKLLSPKLERIVIIGRDAQVAATINTEHRNPQYLADIILPECVVAGTEIAAASKHPLIIFAVPTAATRQCAKELVAAGVSPDAVLLSCAKGIERSSGERMSEILKELLPDNEVAALSGPNHAEEIARGQAACAVIGCTDAGVAMALQDLFTLPHFRPYTSTDLAGIELGGAIKNVYAIAAGIAHGLGLGDNATAALVTRALAEMTRLGVALGGRQETFSGLSGVGDLLVTCFSEHSRNHKVGLALGRGKTLAEATDALGMVAEGVPNTLSIHEAARKAGVRTPIIDAAFSMLYENKPAAEAMMELLSRDTRMESE